MVAYGLSQRRACVLRQLRRSTLSSQGRPERDAELAAQIHELARRYPRYGYRRVWALLRRRGQPANTKRVHRLWTRATWQVRRGRRKRRLVRAASPPVQARHPSQVWPYDFLHDRCLKGTPLKVLTVMDECTREGLAIEGASSLPSPRVVAVLERLVAIHGAPQFVRSDKGPAFVALAIRTWLIQHQTGTLSIDPGRPWQNGYGERFNGTVRDEGLNRHSFPSVAEARAVLAGYRRQ